MTSVNKDIKSKIKFCRQSCSYCFENLWLSKFSFHHKWKEVCLLITNWHIRVLSRELPNNLRLRILGIQKILQNLHRIIHRIIQLCQIFIELLPSLQSPSRNFVNTSKNLLKNRNWTFIVLRYFTWKLELVLNFWWMIVGALIWIWMASDQLQLVPGRFWLIVDDLEWLWLV